MRTYDKTHLSDADLMRELAATVAESRTRQAQILAHLAEAEARGLDVQRDRESLDLDLSAPGRMAQPSPSCDTSPETVDPVALPSGIVGLSALARMKNQALSDKETTVRAFPSEGIGSSAARRMENQYFSAAGDGLLTGILIRKRKEGRNKRKPKRHRK